MEFEHPCLYITLHFLHNSVFMRPLQLLWSTLEILNIVYQYQDILSLPYIYYFKILLVIVSYCQRHSKCLKSQKYRLILNHVLSFLDGTAPLAALYLT